MATPETGASHVPGSQANTESDTSRRWPCPVHEADPSSSTIPERCRDWSGPTIAEVTRHLKKLHPDCHEFVASLSFSKLQAEARYQLYLSFFVGLSQRNTQGQAYLPRNLQDDSSFDGLAQPVHQPDIPSRQGGNLPPQQLLRDTMANHDSFNHVPETDNHSFLPLNDTHPTTRFHAPANAHTGLAANGSMVIPSTAPLDQSWTWSNPSERISYSDTVPTFDNEQPPNPYTWHNNGYTRGAFAQPVPAYHNVTPSTMTAQPTIQDMTMQGPNAQLNQYRGQISSSTTLSYPLQKPNHSEVCCCRCHLPEYHLVSCFKCQIIWGKTQCNCGGRETCCLCRSPALPVTPQMQQSRSYGPDERGTF